MGTEKDRFDEIERDAYVGPALNDLRRRDRKAYAEERAGLQDAIELSDNAPPIDANLLETLQQIAGLYEDEKVNGPAAKRKLSGHFRRLDRKFAWSYWKKGGPFNSSRSNNEVYGQACRRTIGPEVMRMLQSVRQVDGYNRMVPQNVIRLMSGAYHLFRELAKNLFEVGQCPLAKRLQVTEQLTYEAAYPQIDGDLPVYARAMVTTAYIMAFTDTIPTHKNIAFYLTPFTLSQFKRELTEKDIGEIMQEEGCAAAFQYYFARIEALILLGMTPERLVPIISNLEYDEQSGTSPTLERVLVRAMRERGLTQDDLDRMVINHRLGRAKIPLQIRQAVRNTLLEK